MPDPCQQQNNAPYPRQPTPRFHPLSSHPELRHAPDSTLPVPLLVFAAQLDQLEPTISCIPHWHSDSFGFFGFISFPWFFIHLVLFAWQTHTQDSTERFSASAAPNTTSHGRGFALQCLERKF
jgi:hypothetical protein